ncbi:unnamed protein product [Penicillium manginii]
MAKGSKRPKTQRGLNKSTGFEEYNADGPLTPAEHDELSLLYNPRFEDALMRFQHKRRILPDRLNVFHKYLVYGGVSAGPNYGTGVSAKEVKGMTDEEAMQARTQTAVEKSREGLKLDISFNEVAKGFLGSFFVSHFNPERREDIDLATVTLRNFYTYLLYHDVCPEYKDDLEQARKTCDLAAIELLKTMQLVHKAPGAFNRCCSMLFGGYHFASEWESTPVDGLKSGIEKSDQIARKVVKYAIAGAGSNEQASRFQELVHQNSISTMKLEDIDGFEILEVIQPDDATCEFYQQSAPDLVPVGKIRAKSYRDPANPDIDMSPDERTEWDKGNGPAYDLEFFLEPELLKFCYPRLKIITGIWEINCGVYYFDEIMSTLPSFYTLIANDLMMHWRWPQELSKEDKKQDDAIEQSAREAVDQYLKANDPNNPSDSTVVTGVSEKVLEKCKDMTGIKTLKLAGPPMEKTGMEESDSDDDEL